MFFISVKKHNRIVDDLRDSYAKKLKDLEKENETKRWNWLKERSSYTSNLEKENKNLKDIQKDLSEDNTALRLEIGLLKENASNFEKIKEELKVAKNSIGGLKSSITKKNDKILRLQNELKIANNGGYKIHKIRATKNPKMKTSIIAKGPKNSQVNKILKELGENND